MGARLETGTLRLRRVVITTSRLDDGTIQVTVRDAGPGIPADVIKRIFEPFVTTKAQGLGMGLNISRAIVEAHGGRLTAESGEDCGTLLSFTVGTDPS